MGLPFQLENGYACLSRQEYVSISSSFLRRSCHVAAGLLSLLTVTLLGSCVEGTTPVELPLTTSQALFTVDPQTFQALQSEGAPEIVRIRVVGRVFGGTKGVGFSEVPVDPDASSWTVGIEITPPPGKDPQIELTVELMNLSLAPGTAQVQATAGPMTETRQIQVLPALDRIVITPPEYSFRNYGDFAQFWATVFDVEENVVEDEAVNWTVDDPNREVVDYNPGESLFVSVGNGTATVTATVEEEPEIQATAQGYGTTRIWVKVVELATPPRRSAHQRAIHPYRHSSPGLRPLHADGPSRVR